MTRRKDAPRHWRQHRSYQKHGLCALKRAVMELGSRAIDRRTQVGKALVEWRGGLIQDLGGNDTLSTQQYALVDVAVKTKLLLDSADGWLLSQPSLVNGRKRCLFPVVLQRQQLADSLVRILEKLGLERRVRPAMTLQEYIAKKTGEA